LAIEQSSDERITPPFLLVKISRYGLCHNFYFPSREFITIHHRNGDGNDGSTAEPSLRHTSTPSSHSNKGVAMWTCPKYRQINPKLPQINVFYV
jgi:hypothetical protein